MVLVLVVLTERLLLLLLLRSNSAASKRANLRLADLARESSERALIVDRFDALSVDTKNERGEERTTLRHCQFAQALSLSLSGSPS